MNSRSSTRIGSLEETRHVDSSRLRIRRCSVYLHVFLTTRRRILDGDFGSARRQEISDLLLKITDSVRQPEIIGAQSAQRCEGFALSKDHYLRGVRRDG